MALNLPQLEASKAIADLVRQLNGWRTALNALGFPALRRGVEIQQTITTSDTVVKHGLRGVPRGWVILRAEGSTPAAVCEVSSNENDLVLKASATTTLTLWVYV